MQVWFVFSLFFAVVIAVFAVQNSDVVKIDLFWYDWELSQSLVILISAAFGAIIAIFLGLFSRIKSSLKVRELNNDLKAAEKKIELLTSSVKSCEERLSAAAAKASSSAQQSATIPGVTDESPSGSGTSASS